MTKYKKDDKVVVKVKKVACNITGNQLLIFDPTAHVGLIADDEQVLGKLEDFQSKEDKITMTQDEKREFDRLRAAIDSVYGAMLHIDVNTCPDLYRRLFENENNNKAQLEFSRAWDKPSRIEVIEPEHEFKAGDLVRVRYFGENAIILSTAPSVDGVQDKDVIKIAYTDGSSEWIAKDRLEFIKSNAISWE